MDTRHGELDQTKNADAENMGSQQCPHARPPSIWFHDQSRNGSPGPTAAPSLAPAQDCDPIYLRADRRAATVWEAHIDQEVRAHPDPRPRAYPGPAVEDCPDSDPCVAGPPAAGTIGATARAFVLESNLGSRSPSPVTLIGAAPAVHWPDDFQSPSPGTPPRRPNAGTPKSQGSSGTAASQAVVFRYGRPLPLDLETAPDFHGYP
jgi:hypothetical protein